MVIIVETQKFAPFKHVKTAYLTKKVEKKRKKKAHKNREKCCEERR